MKKIMMIFILGLVMQVNSQVTQVVREKISLSDILKEETAVGEAEKAAARFGLTGAQKTMWESAAVQRRELNRPYLEKLNDSLTLNEEQSAHLQIRRNQDSFYERITEHLTPLQLEEFDRERNALLRMPERTDTTDTEKNPSQE